VTDRPFASDFCQSAPTCILRLGALPLKDRQLRDGTARETSRKGQNRPEDSKPLECRVSIIMMLLMSKTKTAWRLSSRSPFPFPHNFVIRLHLNHMLPHLIQEVPHLTSMLPPLRQFLSPHLTPHLLFQSILVASLNNQL
jgi:hypothetical protein